MNDKETFDIIKATAAISILKKNNYMLYIDEGKEKLFDKVASKCTAYPISIKYNQIYKVDIKNKYISIIDENGLCIHKQDFYYEELSNKEWDTWVDIMAFIFTEFYHISLSNEILSDILKGKYNNIVSNVDDDEQKAKDYKTSIILEAINKAHVVDSFIKSLPEEKDISLTNIALVVYNIELFIKTLNDALPILNNNIVKIYADNYIDKYNYLKNIVMNNENKITTDMINFIIYQLSFNNESNKAFMKHFTTLTYPIYPNIDPHITPFYK